MPKTVEKSAQSIKYPDSIAHGIVLAVINLYDNHIIEHSDSTNSKHQRYQDIRTILIESIAGLELPETQADYFLKSLDVKP